MQCNSSTTTVTVGPLLSFAKSLCYRRLTHEGFARKRVVSLKTHDNQDMLVESLVSTSLEKDVEP